MQFNWPIIGHVAAVQLLQTALATNQLHHAYLLVGPRGLGKRTLADLCMKSLLCEARLTGTFLPCSLCMSCKMYAKRNHPDVIWLARGAERTISIDAVRACIERLHASSFLRSYKVAVLEDADCLSGEAAHALLKILEEPPPHTVFILTAQHRASLPATVCSRAQIIPLRLQPTSVLEAYLQSKGMSHAHAKARAKVCFGIPGRACNLEDDAIWKTWCQGFIKARLFWNSNHGVQSAMIPSMLKEYGEEQLIFLFCATAREMLLQEQNNAGVARMEALHTIPSLLAHNVAPRVAFEYGACMI